MKIAHVMKTKQMPFVLFGLFLVCLAVIPSTYFYRKYKKSEKQLTQTEQQDVSILIARIGRHILLPEGETPQVLVVTDKEKASGQDFFKHAQNGDTVLVYYEAKQAFLYNPQTDKVLAVGPLIVSPTPEASPSAALTKSPSPTVTVTAAVSATPKSEAVTFFLINGTKTAGLAKSYESTLKGKMSDAVVTGTGNSVGDYESSIIVPMSAKGKTLGDTVARQLDLEAAAELPEGELAKTADFIIFLGEDAVGK